MNEGILDIYVISSSSLWLVTERKLVILGEGQDSQFIS